MCAHIHTHAYTSARARTAHINIYFFTEGEKPETKQKRLEAKYAALQIVPNVDKLGTAKVRDVS